MIQDTNELARVARHELKFILDAETAKFMRERLAPFMTRDGHTNGDGYYLNRSLYFDTANLDDYWEYVDGERARRKVRLRSYSLESQTCNLEVKHKLNRMVWKSRYACTKQEAIDLLARPWDAGGTPERDQIVSTIMRRRYEPKITVVYQREPWVDVVERSLRVTFDYNIRCGAPELFDRLPTPDDVRVFFPGLMVMEAKFAKTVPRWFRDVVRQAGLSPETCSKYVLAIERLYRGEPLAVRGR